MSNIYAVLPCNGLDKCAGCVSKETALLLADKGSEIICPVFYRIAAAKYDKLAAELPLAVIDGCPTRCASKLAAEKELKITKKVNVSDFAKEKGIEIGGNLRLTKNELELAEMIANELTEKKDSAAEVAAGVAFPGELHYETYKKDKFVFRLPKDGGFYFIA